MRVAIVEPHGSGGNCHYTYELSRALAMNGVDVFVFTNDEYELDHLNRNFAVSSLSSSRLKARLEQVKERVYPKSWRGTSAQQVTNQQSTIVNDQARSLDKNDTSRSRDFARNCYMQFEAICRMKALGIRVIHIQWAWPSRRHLLFVRLAKLAGIKVVYTAHNILAHEDNSEATKSEMANYYREVDSIIVHDRSCKSELLSIFDIESEKVHVIPHGNYQVFTEYDSKSRARLRSELGVPDNRDVILFFGLIRKYKGLDVLLPAFKVALEQRRRLYLLIAGKVAEQHGESAAHYDKLIRRLGIESDVNFRPGYVAMEDVPNIFTIADVVVAPYIKTYQSGIVQMAYAFGKPVIATNTGGLGEVVVHGESGYIIEPENGEQLASAMIEIFDDGAALERMSLRAAELSRTRYSWEKIAKATIRLYGG